MSYGVVITARRAEEGGGAIEELHLGNFAEWGAAIQSLINLPFMPLSVVLIRDVDANEFVLVACVTLDL